MALYYSLSKLNSQKKNDSFEVNQTISNFVFLAETKLIKLEKAISKKKYEKVIKHVLKLKKHLILYEMDDCVENSDVICAWAENKGPKKAIKEVFKVYKICLEKALKEMRKDFKISLSEYL